MLMKASEPATIPIGRPCRILDPGKPVRQRRGGEQDHGTDRHEDGADHELADRERPAGETGRVEATQHARLAVRRDVDGQHDQPDGGDHDAEVGGDVVVARERAFERRIVVVEHAAEHEHGDDREREDERQHEWLAQQEPQLGSEESAGHVHAARPCRDTRADQLEHGVFERWLVDVEVDRNGSAASPARVDQVGTDVGQHPAVAPQLDPVAGQPDRAHAADRTQLGGLGLRVGERHSDAGTVLLDELGG